MRRERKNIMENGIQSYHEEERLKYDVVISIILPDT